MDAFLVKQQARNTLHRGSKSDHLRYDLKKSNLKDNTPLENSASRRFRNYKTLIVDKLIVTFFRKKLLRKMLTSKIRKRWNTLFSEEARAALLKSFPAKGLRERSKSTNSDQHSFLHRYQEARDSFTSLLKGGFSQGAKSLSTLRRKRNRLTRSKSLPYLDLGVITEENGISDSDFSLNDKTKRHRELLFESLIRGREKSFTEIQREKKNVRQNSENEFDKEKQYDKLQTSNLVRTDTDLEKKNFEKQSSEKEFEEQKRSDKLQNNYPVKQKEKEVLFKRVSFGKMSSSSLPRELKLIIDDICNENCHLLEWEVFGNATDDMRIVLTWRRVDKEKKNGRRGSLGKWKLRQSSINLDELGAGGEKDEQWDKKQGGGDGKKHEDEKERARRLQEEDDEQRRRLEEEVEKRRKKADKAERRRREEEEEEERQRLLEEKAAKKERKRQQEAEEEERRRQEKEEERRRREEEVKRKIQEEAEAEKRRLEEEQDAQRKKREAEEKQHLQNLKKKMMEEEEEKKRKHLEHLEAEKKKFEEEEKRRQEEIERKLREEEDAMRRRQSEYDVEEKRKQDEIGRRLDEEKREEMQRMLDEEEKQAELQLLKEKEEAEARRKNEEENGSSKKKKNPFRKLKKDEKLQKKKGKLQLSLSMDEGEAFLDQQKNNDENEENENLTNGEDKLSTRKTSIPQEVLSVEEQELLNKVLQREDQDAQERARSKEAAKKALNMQRNKFKLSIDDSTYDELDVNLFPAMGSVIEEAEDVKSISDARQRDNNLSLGKADFKIRVSPFPNVVLGKTGWERCGDCKYNGFCDDITHKSEYMAIILLDAERNGSYEQDCKCNVCNGGAVHNGCIYREILRLKTDYRLFDKRNLCLCKVCIPFKYRKVCLRQELRELKRDGRDLYYRMAVPYYFDGFDGFEDTNDECISSKAAGCCFTKNTFYRGCKADHLRLLFHGEDGNEGYHPTDIIGEEQLDMNYNSEEEEERINKQDQAPNAMCLSDIQLELGKKDKIDFRNCIECQFNGFCDDIRHKKLYHMLLRIDDEDFEDLEDECGCLVCEFNGAAHSGCITRELKRLKYDVMLFDVRNLCTCSQCVPFKYRKSCLRQEMKMLRRLKGRDYYEKL